MPAQSLPYLRPTYVEQWRVGHHLAGTLASALVMSSIGLLAMLVMTLLALSGHLPWWVALLTTPGAIPMLIPLIMSAATVTTTVEPALLRLSLHVAGLPLWRRTVPLRQIQSCHTARPGDTIDGHPIPTQTALLRRTLDTTYLMLTAHPVVVLTLNPFNHLVIGSRTPDALADAIRAGMTLSPPSAP